MLLITDLKVNSLQMPNIIGHVVVKQLEKKPSSRKMNTEVSTGSGKSEKNYHSRYEMRGI